MTRIATTHVGSLPRRKRTVDFIFARERGESFDAGDFAACMAEECAQTVRRQVEIVGLDRVIAGTDCGFGTFAGFGAVDPDIACVKLAALAEGAAIASART